MGELVLEIIVGLVLVVIGIMNRKGNISLLHSYHKKRVKEEDVIPFGKQVGMGTMIIGIAIVLAGILSVLNFGMIRDVVIGIGLVIGIFIIFRAMRKYNNGVF